MFTLYLIILCGGDDCMLTLWWLYVVVEAVHGGEGIFNPCVAVVVLLYDYIHAWWLWYIVAIYHVPSCNIYTMVL